MWIVTTSGRFSSSPEAEASCACAALCRDAPTIARLPAGCAWTRAQLRAKAEGGSLGRSLRRHTSHLAGPEAPRAPAGSAGLVESVKIPSSSSRSSSSAANSLIQSGWFRLIGRKRALPRSAVPPRGSQRDDGLSAQPGGLGHPLANGLLTESPPDPVNGPERRRTLMDENAL